MSYSKRVEGVYEGVVPAVGSFEERRRFDQNTVVKEGRLEVRKSEHVSYKILVVLDTYLPLP